MECTNRKPPAVSYDQELPDVSDSSPILSKPLPILVRATDGKSRTNRGDRVKLSTVVAPDALDGFYARYADVCKAGMTALKPRDRTKRKAKAKKKKVGMGQTSMAAIP